jgi:hypothetical protein
MYIYSKKSLFLLIGSVFFVISCKVAFATSAPGGFVESQTSTAVRAPYTASNAAQIVPAARGKFTFPAPYNTEAYRITIPADCPGSTDCVNSIGYSYWANMNNSTGSNLMYMFVGLEKAYGTGDGINIFSLDKTTGSVVKVGSLFPANDRRSYWSGEGFYFSPVRPSILYVKSSTDPFLQTYDIFTHTTQTVFDISSAPGVAVFGANRYITQVHTSNDELNHSFTVSDTSNYYPTGCGVYLGASNTFKFYPIPAGSTDYDECQIDKSGQWLLIKEQLDNVDDVDSRVINLSTNQQTDYLNQVINGVNNAVGHSDVGFGYVVGFDHWGYDYPQYRLWQLGSSPHSPGTIIYRDPSWSSGGSMGHVSWVNAAPENVTPLNKQFLCGALAVPFATSGTRSNEIDCFKPDNSQDVLVVAPIMTNLAATGGGSGYNQDAKGNVDPTGQYFIWNSNLGTSRQDIFVVKIPYEKLIGLAVPTIDSFTATSLSISSGQSTTLSWSVSGSPSPTVSINNGIGSSGASSTVVVSPTVTTTYTLSATNANGTAVQTVAVTVANVDTTPPVLSSISSSALIQTSASISWTTNEDSDTQVDYGHTTSYGSSTTLNAALVTNHTTALSGLTAGTLYHFRVKSRDLAGNIAVSADQTFTTIAAVVTDTTPPVISSIASLSLTQTTATISWATNESSDTQVDYGTSSSFYGSSTILNPALVLTHSVPLSSLTAGTLYHFRVKSKDNLGNLATSADQTFTSVQGTVSVPNPVPTSTTTPTSVPTPNPTPLVINLKLINNNGTYYLIDHGVKHGITNPGMLATYGFSFSDAKASTIQDDSLPEGSILTPQDGSLVKSKEDQTVYLISNQQRYAFTSATVFFALGFKFSSILLVTNPELQQLPKAENISNSKQAHLPGSDISINGQIDWIGYDNQLHPYPNLAIYNSWHITGDFSTVLIGNDQDKTIPVGSVVSVRVVE